MGAKYTGGCHCGNIRFECDAEPLVHLACHCNDCRQATGKDFSDIAFFNSNAITRTGTPDAHVFTADSGNKTRREYCENCGTVVFDKSEGFKGLTGIFTSEIAKPKLPNPKIHVWVSSKLGDVHISPRLKSFEKGLPQN